jgi:hypothetical protein
MVLMRADPFRGQVGGGAIETFLGPVKGHRAVRRVQFGAQKNRDFQGPTPSHLPSQWICPHQNNYVLGTINHRSINSYKYDYSPPSDSFMSQYSHLDQMEGRNMVELGASNGDPESFHTFNTYISQYFTS